MYLPPEILKMIFADLEKRDLKASRLTCKAWNSEIPPFLFNSVFITARYADLEVADLVASIYGAFVETMVYSVEYFEEDESWNNYFQSAREQIYAEEKCFSEEVTDNSRYDTERCRDDHALPFWRIYDKLAEEQENIMSGRTIYQQLIRAFKSMPRISKVVLTHSWRKRGHCWCEQAAIDAKRRSHKPFDATDADVDFDEGCCISRYYVGRGCIQSVPGYRSSTHSASSWRDLVEALNSSDNAVREITSDLPTNDVETRLPAEMWDPTFELDTITSNTFSSLTRLQIALDLNEVEEMPDWPWKSPQFTQVLSSAYNLTCLHITLAYRYWARVTRWDGTDFEALFSECSLPKLRTLSLDLFTAEEDEVPAFLIKSPELQCLSLKRFGLMEGIWVAMIQTIRDSTRIKELHLELITGSMIRDEDTHRYDLDVLEFNFGPKLLEIFHREKGTPFTREDFRNIVHDSEKIMYPGLFTDSDGADDYGSDESCDFYDEEPTDGDDTEDGESNSCPCCHHHHTPTEIRDGEDISSDSLPVYGPDTKRELDVNDPGPSNSSRCSSVEAKCIDYASGTVHLH